MPAVHVRIIGMLGEVGKNERSQLQAFKQEETLIFIMSNTNSRESYNGKKRWRSRPLIVKCTARLHIILIVSMVRYRDTRHTVALKKSKTIIVSCCRKPEYIWGEGRDTEGSRLYVTLKILRNI